MLHSAILRDRCRLFDSLVASKDGAFFFLLSFREGNFSLFPVPVSIHKMLWQMFWDFDGVIFAALVKPAQSVVRTGLCCEKADNPFYSVLLLLLVVPQFVRGLETSWFEFNSSRYW